MKSSTDLNIPGSPKPWWSWFQERACHTDIQMFFYRCKNIYRCFEFFWYMWAKNFVVYSLFAGVGSFSICDFFFFCFCGISPLPPQLQCLFVEISGFSINRVTIAEEYPLLYTFLLGHSSYHLLHLPIWQFTFSPQTCCKVEIILILKASGF